MTAATLDFSRVNEVRAPRLSFLGLLRTERIALLSLRSTFWTALIGTVLTSAFAVLFTVMRHMIAASGGAAAQSIDSSAVMAMMNSTAVPTVVAIVVGASLYGREQSTGALTTLFAAAPRRSAIVAAKTIVLSVSLAAWTLAASLVAIGAATLTDLAFGVRALPFSAPGDLTAVLGITFVTVLTGVLSMGVAMLLRSERWTVTIMAMFIFFIGGVLASIPVEWVATLSQYLFPVSQGVFIVPGAEVLDNIRLVLVSLAWPAAALAAGLVVVNRRDA